MAGKGKPGRKATPIEPGMVMNLRMIGASLDEIAAVIGINLRTFQRRVGADPKLREAVDFGAARGRATLRRLQWQGAQKGNPTMLIWLGKQMLGQRDRHDVEVREAPALDLAGATAEQLEILREAARVVRELQAEQQQESGQNGESLTIEHQPHEAA